MQQHWRWWIDQVGLFGMTIQSGHGQLHGRVVQLSQEKKVKRPLLMDSKKEYIETPRPGSNKTKNCKIGLDVTPKIYVITKIGLVQKLISDS